MPLLAGQAVKHYTMETGQAPSANTMDLAGIINQVQQSLHSQEGDLRAQYVGMQMAPCALALCIAARFQGLYKAEEFIQCYSDLHLNTTAAGKLVTGHTAKSKGDVGLT